MQSESFGSVRVFWPRYERDELIALLHEGAKELQRTLPLARAVLFGSWSTGRATAFSDVDVLVIYCGPPRADAYRLALGAFRVPRIELHLYSEEEARRLEPTFAHMTERGVELL